MSPINTVIFIMAMILFVRYLRITVGSVIMGVLISKMRGGLGIEALIALAYVVGEIGLLCLAIAFCPFFITFGWK
jgi:hypothetical protein